MDHAPNETCFERSVGPCFIQNACVLVHECTMLSAPRISCRCRLTRRLPSNGMTRDRLGPASHGEANAEDASRQPPAHHAVQPVLPAEPTNATQSVNAHVHDPPATQPAGDTVPLQPHPGGYASAAERPCGPLQGQLPMHAPVSYQQPWEGQGVGQPPWPANGMHAFPTLQQPQTSGGPFPPGPLQPVRRMGEAKHMGSAPLHDGSAMHNSPVATAAVSLHQAPPGYGHPAPVATLGVGDAAASFGCAPGMPDASGAGHQHSAPLPMDGGGLVCQQPGQVEEHGVWGSAGGGGWGAPAADHAPMHAAVDSRTRAGGGTDATGHAPTECSGVDGRPAFVGAMDGHPAGVEHPPLPVDAPPLPPTSPPLPPEAPPGYGDAPL